MRARRPRHPRRPRRPRCSRRPRRPSVGAVGAVCDARGIRGIRGVLGCSAMFAGCQFVSQILDIGCNLVISSACCNDSRSSSGFRQTSKRSFNSDETAVVTRIAVRAPLTTDDDDERRTTQDGNQSRSYMAVRNMPSLRWADTGLMAWRPPRWRGYVMWRCTPPVGRAVLSEVCGRFKSVFFCFGMPPPGTSARAIGFRRDGCVK